MTPIASVARQGNGCLSIGMRPQSRSRSEWSVLTYHQFGSLQLLHSENSALTRSFPQIFLPARFGFCLNAAFLSAKYRSIACLCLGLGLIVAVMDYRPCHPAEHGHQRAIPRFIIVDGRGWGRKCFEGLDTIQPRSLIDWLEWK